MRLVLVATLLVSGSALASSMNWVSVNPSDPDDVELFVEEVSTPPGIEKTIKELVPQIGGSKELVIIDQIINLGQKIWKIIEKNQPVINVKYTYANALPKGVNGPEDLEGFSRLQSRSFHMSGKNPFGSRVYDVTYTLLHRYGGSYEGRGRYLDTVTVLPSKISANWGYKISFSVDKLSTMNVGSRKDPVAGALMEMTFKVETVVKKHQYRGVYEFRGDSPRVGTID